MRTRSAEGGLRFLLSLCMAMFDSLARRTKEDQLGDGRMKTILGKFLVFGGMMTLSANSFADVFTVTGVQITKVYAQSRLDSTAHLIRLNQTIDSSCHWNRVYILLDDKELFATALAKHLTSSSVDIIYETNAPSKMVAMHIPATCRVISIF